jgi:DNA-binding MarR family transcriptional regulator
MRANDVDSGERSAFNRVPARGHHDDGLGGGLLMSNPLHVDPEAPQVSGEHLVRAEQCIALLQRRLIKPMGRGGPRSELTLTQYHAMSFLAARGKASVTEIKDMLGFAQSTTSVLVDKLGKMGLVEKRRERRDQRVACVVPLPKGLRMVQRFRKNAERNLVTLIDLAGDSAVRDVFDALERAVIATAPLENPGTAKARLRAARRRGAAVAAAKDGDAALRYLTAAE